MAAYGEGCGVGDFGGRGGFVGTPFLHAGSIDVFAGVLWDILVLVDACIWCMAGRTSNVIHDMGWSSGISVRLTRSRERHSSSNTTVKIAPGGVLCASTQHLLGIHLLPTTYAMTEDSHVPCPNHEMMLHHGSCTCAESTVCK